VLGRLIGLPTRVVVGFVARAGVGWVAFDPMPRPDTAPQPIEEPPRPEPEDSNPPPVEAPIPSLDRTPSAVAAPAVVLARRSLRRRRLATVSGAWLEVVDALRLAGRPDEAVPILEQRLKIPNQQDTVQRELDLAKQQAGES
jgi:hypothetical protein